MAPRSPVLMLLDGHSLAYRAFYALPVENFSTVDGRSTNAVYGFLSMLLNAVRDEQPTHLAVAFDVSRTTFRTHEFPEYKANRSASPPEFKPQIELLRTALEALRIPVISADGYEADDVIATLATRARADGMQVLILTGDRDALQLVDDATTVLYPRKGVSDLHRFTPDGVEEKYGVRPERYADFAAVRGDASDNLPGIPGVGEKTAAKWIREFGSVADLVARVDEVPGKAGAALREHLDNVVRNRRLTELVRDVDLGVAADDLERKPADPADVDALFDDLEFRALRDRVSVLMAEASASAPDPASTSASDALSAGQDAGVGDWSTWIEALEGGALVGVYAEAAAGGRELARLALAAGSEAIAGPADSIGQGDREALRTLLGGAIPKAVHDLNATSLLLSSIVDEIASVEMDSLLAAYLVAPDARGYELDLLSRTRLGRSLDLSPSGDAAQEALFSENDDGARNGVGRACARTVRDLDAALRPVVQAHGAERLLHEIEIPLTTVLVRMERRGIAVDRDGLRALATRFDKAAGVAAVEAERIVGHPVNLASPKQLQQVLFDELGMPTTRRTKTGFSTDAESLTTLLERTNHPFLQRVQEHRDAAKLRSTVEGLLNAVGDERRICTTFRQTIAATGRLSSTEPNLQNIPVRTADGRSIRACFVPGDGFSALMTADYSQIEMRIMAHLSEDDRLITAFEEGEDLHTSMAADVFGVTPDQVDAEMRRRIKAMSYGLAYGLSAFGLAKQLGTGADEARRLMDDYYARFEGVREYLDEVVARARETGYTETIMGRRRYLPDLNSDNRQRREAAERMALNAPIQGSAADIIKVAMLSVEQRMRSDGMRSRLLLQVHDELVCEVIDDETAAVEALLREQMASAASLRVRLDVSVGAGPDWDRAAH